jgi:hypothetical protein
VSSHVAATASGWLYRTSRAVTGVATFHLTVHRTSETFASVSLNLLRQTVATPSNRAPRSRPG